MTKGSDGSLWITNYWGALRLKPKSKSGSSAGGFRAILYTTEQIAAEFRKRKFGNIETIVVPCPDTFADGKAGICLYGRFPGGAVIVGLVPEGPAARAGLRIGDQITALNGQNRRIIHDFDLSVDDTPLQITVKRPGRNEPQEFVISVTGKRGKTARFCPRAILEDNNGQIWFATRKNRIISLQEDAAQPVWEDHTDRHQLKLRGYPHMAATSDGIAVVTDSRNSGHQGTLLQFTGKNWSQTELPRSDNTAIIRGKDNRLLIGTQGDLFFAEDNRFEKIPLKKHGIFDQRILLYRASDDAIWVAASQASVIRIEPQGGRWTSYDGILYQDTEADGSEWFISDRLSVVRRSGDDWHEFTTADGLMNMPMSVIVTSSGDIWASGSHEGTAATARYDGSHWDLKRHPQLSWAISHRGVFEDNQGHLWFGAAENWDNKLGVEGGVLRFDGQQWSRVKISRKDTYGYIWAMCQPVPDTVWIASPVLFDTRTNKTAAGFREPLASLRGHFCTAMTTGPAGCVWVGTSSRGVAQIRTEGLSEFLSSTDNIPGPSASTQKKRRLVWHRKTSGLSNNHIRSIVAPDDDTVLVNTSAAFERFDGKSWASTAIPDHIADDIDYGGVRVAGKNIWLNRSPLDRLGYRRSLETSDKSDDQLHFQTTKYVPDQAVPKTRITSKPSTIYAGDVVTFVWQATDAWNATPTEKLTYSWKVNRAAWSPFSTATMVQLDDLPAGNHTFAVRCRDADFNQETKAARLEFQVLLPIWQRAWFRVLCGFSFAMAAGLCWQTVSVFRRGARLRLANEQLRTTKHELHRVNMELESRVQRRTKQLQENLVVVEQAHRKSSQLQHQLAQTQKLEAVGTLAAGTAHDFNNSLAAIVGFAESLKKRCSDDSKGTAYADSLIDVAHQAADTTKQLMTFCGETPDEKTATNICELIKSSESILRQVLPATIQLDISVPEGADIICEANGSLLKQTLMNLVINARDAMPDGGTISVTADPACSRPGFMLLSITDNGSGMSPEVLDRVFEPFFTTKERGQGTGLGLAVVHGIIQDHGGTLEVTSSVGIGTTVTILLPCSDSALSKRPSLQEVIPDGSGKTVLLAEDNAEVRLALKTQLEAAGFDVVECCDGPSVLEAWKTHQPDLLLLDIDLPGMSGYSCLMRIREQEPRVAAILMTGTSPDITGLSDETVLRKPFGEARLFDSIRQTLQDAASAPTSASVMVIDDNAIVRESTQAMLEHLGWNAVLAGDGRQALDFIQQHHPKTILMDWNMPETDPEQLIGELKKAAPNSRIFVITGELTDNNRFVHQGVEGVVKKPFTLDKLREVLTSSAGFRRTA